MKQLPVCTQSLVVRTDFKNSEAWAKFQAEVMKPHQGFDPDLRLVDDREFEGLTLENVASRLPKEHELVLFLADEEALASDDFPVLVLDLVDEPFESFRAVCTEVGSIADNIKIGTVDFFQFAGEADESGVFRGFNDTAKPAAEVPSANLYIGNLPFNATAELLTQTFATAGRVVSAHLAKDEAGRMRGFARVEMADTAAAQSVIEKCNGRELNGRAILVAFDGPQWPK